MQTIFPRIFKLAKSWVPEHFKSLDVTHEEVISRCAKWRLMEDRSAAISSSWFIFVDMTCLAPSGKLWAVPNPNSHRSLHEYHVDPLHNMQWQAL